MFWCAQIVADAHPVRSNVRGNRLQYNKRVRYRVARHGHGRHLHVQHEQLNVFSINAMFLGSGTQLST